MHMLKTVSFVGIDKGGGASAACPPPAPVLKAPLRSLSDLCGYLRDAKGEGVALPVLYQMRYSTACKCAASFALASSAGFSLPVLCRICEPFEYTALPSLQSV